MRPVVKGPAPKVVYAPYGEALNDLLDRLGAFCSYCEQVITHAPEVEHVQPKSLVPGLEHDWNNFLLGCKSCNTIKHNTPVDLDQVAFPDVDNTFLALDFHSDGRISLANHLGAAQVPLMEAVIKLVKLHRHPAALTRADRPSKRDNRVKLRLDVWDIARHQLGNYEDFLYDPDFSEILAETIAKHLAPAKGFFSIWMTVFRDHPDMLRRLIAAFPGTDAASFDTDGQPVSRPGGRF